MNREDHMESLQRRISEAARNHKSTGALTARLCALKTRKIHEENVMTYAQEARDGEMRHQITQSCQVIKSHASFVGVSADTMARLPTDYTPACMDELNEAEGVLRRAVDRIERAKEIMLAKMPQVTSEAAE